MYAYKDKYFKAVFIFFLISLQICICGSAILADFIPPPIKSRRIHASDDWPNSIHHSIHHHITTSSQPMSFHARNPSIHANDKSLHRLVKQTRDASESYRSNWTQVEPQTFFPINYVRPRFHVQEDTGWSLNAEILSGRTNNKKEGNWDNSSDNRLGKRKMFDINVNLDDYNLECSWETLDEEDRDETPHSGSGSDSDSEAYSGPS